MKYLLVNNKGTIVAVSDQKVRAANKSVVAIDMGTTGSLKLLGRKIVKKDGNDLRLAVVCNWRQPCGISTYTQYLVEHFRHKTESVKIFSEVEGDRSHDEEENVVRCWRRGESMQGLINELDAWEPNFVLIQHEFGLFPKATHFLRMIQDLDRYPHAITMHSIYENHLDKTICSSAIKNIIAHSNEGKAVLESLGHDNSKIYVIPHGCPQPEVKEPLWNIFQTEHTIFQFGFGFFYKGVDRAIEAVAELKKKYSDVFYCMLASENPNTRSVHNEYYEHLVDKIDELDLHDNVAVLRGFHSMQVIENYLRTSKVAIFPYLVDPNNTVYGASGAMRIAMASGIPVIASESHLFDDVEDILPRPASAEALAGQIDMVFKKENYRNDIIEHGFEYLRNNSWEKCAQMYIDTANEIINNSFIAIQK